MRIITGTLRGRRLHPPVSIPVRPTTDTAKESLFNILNNLVDYTQLNVLDLFAGTGSISFEFISRGSQSVMSVDNNVKCIKFIQETSEAFKIGNHQVVRTDAFVFLKHIKIKFDLIFADPPYDLAKVKDIPNIVFAKEILSPEGILVLEHSKDIDFTTHTNFSQLRTYGKVNFSFFDYNKQNI